LRALSEDGVDATIGAPPDLDASTEVFLGASWALELLAGASVLFVVAGINNTWRLVMWILEHRVPETKTEE
jgi:hypothetical protein